MIEEFETAVAEFDERSGIGHVTLDRPDSLNALDSRLRRDIVTALGWLEGRDDDDGIALRAVVVEGAGENFCAGADINEFDGASPGRRSKRNHYDFVVDYPVPIVAKIRGYCLGGGLETAMACDFRFAHEDARFGLPEIDLGIVPGAGGVQFISRLANPSTAKEIAMTGDHISAARARELGIVNRVQGEDLDDVTREFAETLASKPPLAIQAIKDAANVAVQAGLQEGRKYDRRLSESLMDTADHEEGVRAFAEDGYEPEFEGR
jgi:enoyl-CoA hydratase/carnithine racemase